MKANVLLSIVCIFSTLLVCAQDAKFGKVSLEQLQQKQHPIEPNADAAYLHKEYNTVFMQSESDGFYIEIEVFERIKIYTKEGFDFATKSINLYQGSNNNNENLSDLKAITYSIVDGKIEEDKLKNKNVFKEEKTVFLSQVNFTMPNVSPGTIIDIKYKISSPFISNIDAFVLQDKIPTDYYDLKFATPQYFVYKLHQKGLYPFEVTTSTKNRTMDISYVSDQQVPTNDKYTKITSGRTERQKITFEEKVYSVKKTNIPSLLPEPMSSNIKNYSAALKFELSFTQFPNSGINYYTTTWEDVSKSIYNTDTFGGELSNANFFKNEVQSMIENATTTEEKIVSIYENVKRNVAWDGFYGVYTKEGVKKAFNQQKGNVADINLLLVGLMREAGIPANPVLISTVDNGIPLFPTQNGFNYVICGVEMNNAVILLDATYRLGIPNVIQKKLLNWEGRLVREDGSSSWVPLNNSDISLDNSMMLIDVDQELNCTGKYRRQLTDYNAMDFREAYINVKEEDLKRELETDGLMISNLEVKSIKDIYEPVQITYDFNSDDIIEEIGGQIFINPLTFLSMKESIFKANQRKLPIFFGYPQKDRFNVTITIPDTYTVASLPESQSLNLVDSKATYRYSINQNGNTIQVSVERAINTPVFSPLNYEGLKSFFETIVKKESEKIVLTKT